MLNLRFTIGGLLVASLGSLAMALFFEHGLDLAPCVLCYYQRALFLLLALTSGIALLQFDRLNQRALWALCGLPLLGILGLSIYQSMIERHLLPVPQACRGTLTQWTSVDQLREQMMTKPLPACDVVQWQFMGLSLSDFAIVFAVGALIALYLSPRRGKRYA